MAARTVKKNEDFGDPFGGETNDEAQTDQTNTGPNDTAPWGDQATVNQDAGKVTVVTTSNESKVTATLKAGAGYDSPWLVFHGSSVTELLEMMSDPNFPKLLTWTTASAQKFGEGWKPAAPVSDLVKNVSSAPQGKPEAATNTGNTPYCKHGAMTPRSGFKNGRAWSGHFCPTPQGTADQCSPKFG
jgi:hypothetical protein